MLNSISALCRHSRQIIFLGLILVAFQVKPANAFDIRGEFGFSSPLSVSMKDVAYNGGTYDRSNDNGAVFGIGFGFPLSSTSNLDLTADYHSEADRKIISRGIAFGPSTESTFSTFVYTLMPTYRYQADFGQGDLYANFLVGVGVSIIHSSNIHAINSGGTYYTGFSSRTQFAWSAKVGGGIGYHFRDNLSAELGYRLFYAGYSEPRRDSALENEGQGLVGPSWSDLYGSDNLSHDIILGLNVRF
ncbi:MAG: outer membrane beta-barrel protein [Alphaproteobacteria bacterium]|nr:outer membrane beta-barrel protein [Alphaproteobacteria bacterium]